MPPERSSGTSGNRNRRARTIGQTAIALISVLILGINGYAWASLQSVNSGIRGSDVIGSGGNQADGATDILLVGNDSRVDAQGNPLPQNVLDELGTSDVEGDRTDTMILVRVPNGGGRASAMSFPRDTKVQLGRGYGEHKLTEAYGLAKADATKQLAKKGVTDPKEQEKQSRAEAQKFLIETLNGLSGVKIDHYAEVNLLGFYNITNAIGGVPVCLKESKSTDNLQDSYSGANFKPGPQDIQGSQALAFVRQRHGLVNEQYRVKRQQAFMSGLAKRVLDAGTLSNPSKLSGLMKSIQQAIVVDSNWDVLGFAEQMQGVAGGDLEFQTAPTHLVGKSGQEETEANPQEIAQFAQNLLLPPEQRKAAEQKQQAEKQARAQTSVNVYNTTQTSGLADQVQENLTGQGYDKGESSNAPPRPSSVVEYGPGDEATAQQVANSLGGIKTQQSPQAKRGTLSVYVASDYQGPGKQSLSGSKATRLDGMQQAKPQQTNPQQANPQPRLQSGSSPTGDEETITADGVPCVQ